MRFAGKIEWIPAQARVHFFSCGPPIRPPHNSELGNRFPHDSSAIAASQCASQFAFRRLRARAPVHATGAVADAQSMIRINERGVTNSLLRIVE
ncbi:hypothetical protein AB4Y92_03365 [Lysobacter sp. TAB13]